MPRSRCRAMSIFSKALIAAMLYGGSGKLDKGEDFATQLLTASGHKSGAPAARQILRRESTLGDKSARDSLRFSKDADQSHQPTCDPVHLTTTSNADHPVKGYSWRLRMLQHCQKDLSDKEWEVMEVRWFTKDCTSLGDTTPVQPNSTMSSGSDNYRYGRFYAFDDNVQTMWKGGLDADGQLWIAASFNKKIAMNCVQFYQCDCLHSVTAVAVETSDAEAWFPVVSSKSPQFGGYTSIQIG